MKINVLREILDLAGKPIGTEKKGENLTLRTVLTGALVSQLQGEIPDGTTSVKRLNLALRIQEEAEIELSVEETGMLIELVGKGYMPLVAGRAIHMLDPTTRKE